jgi:hypothetical protein
MQPFKIKFFFQEFMSSLSVSIANKISGSLGKVPALWAPALHSATQFKSLTKVFLFRIHFDANTTSLPGHGGSIMKGAPVLSTFEVPSLIDIGIHIS